MDHPSSVGSKSDPYLKQLVAQCSSQLIWTLDSCCWVIHILSAAKQDSQETESEVFSLRKVPSTHQSPHQHSWISCKANINRNTRTHLQYKISLAVQKQIQKQIQIISCRASDGLHSASVGKAPQQGIFRLDAIMMILI